MNDTVIAPRYQMRYEQLVNTPVLDRIPYFHDREIEYILEVSKAEQDNVALRVERDELAYWKKEQLAVEATWDDQAVGEELGVPLGASIRAEILPRIKALRAKIERLEGPFTYSECEQSHELAKSDFKDAIDELVHCVDNANRYLTRRFSIEAARGREGE